jgi:hypothetical protein
MRNSKLLQRASQIAQIARYNLQWKKLINHHTKTPAMDWMKFTDIPWPVFDPQPQQPSDLTPMRIKRFFLHPERSAIGFDKTFRLELLHWHPDKFLTLIHPQVVAMEQDNVEEGMQMVSRVLTDLKMARH